MPWLWQILAPCWRETPSCPSNINPDKAEGWRGHGQVLGHTWEHLEPPVAAEGLLPQLLSPYTIVLSEGPKPFLDQLTWGLALSLPGASPTD